jgi:hypothetical protein
VTAVNPNPELLLRLLSDSFGETVAVRDVERIAPWFVSRVHLADAGPGAPRTVIVKWRHGHATNVRTDQEQVLTERASLEFLADLDLPVAPRLLEGDEDAGLLVLEDLAPRVSLFDLLRAGGRDGMASLHTFARTMGELHAANATRSICRQIEVPKKSSLFRSLSIDYSVRQDFFMANNLKPHDTQRQPLTMAQFQVL